MLLFQFQAFPIDQATRFIHLKDKETVRNACSDGTRHNGKTIQGNAEIKVPFECDAVTRNLQMTYSMPYIEYLPDHLRIPMSTILAGMRSMFNDDSIAFMKRNKKVFQDPFYISDVIDKMNKEQEALQQAFTLKEAMVFI